jgi:hypothetical protein
MQSAWCRWVGVFLAFASVVTPGFGGEPNELTAEEKAQGWKLLFDGQSVNGWRGFRKSGFPTQGWLVEDGWLKCVAGGRGGDIVTHEEFEDFELSWEWRLPAKANNGVKYFITEERTQAIGHEYQMLDDSAGARPKQRTAAFYDVLAPEPHKPVRLAPESNTSRIVVSGNQVEHWLNGELVLKYECGSEQVQTAIARSKFRDVPNFGKKMKGRILITYHQDEAHFRNVKIRPLPTRAAAEAGDLSP